MLFIIAASIFVVSSVSAQLRERDSLVTWYSDSNCSASSFSSGPNSPQTLVIAVQNTCQRVPLASSFPGYRVKCGGTSSSIEYCDDIACNNCSVSAVFGSTNTSACLLNDASKFGSSSVSVQCPSLPLGGGGEIQIPAIQKLASNYFEVNWFGQPGCGIPVGPNFDRTIVVGQLEICHRVPNAPTNSGYKVECIGDGARGVITFCSDANCSNCAFATPFTNETCTANDASRFGSASYAIRCPTLTPAIVQQLPSTTPPSSGVVGIVVTPPPSLPLSSPVPSQGGGATGALPTSLAANGALQNGKGSLSVVVVGAGGGMMVAMMMTMMMRNA